MITMICDKTGIQFQADSKRQKNHPRVSQLRQEAAKDKHNVGTYRIALEACAEVKASGSQDIDQAIAYIEDRMRGNTNVKLNARAVEKRERKERNEERIE